MKKINLFFLTLLIAGKLGADEVEDYCKMTRTQAEARSAPLAWPKLFGSLGLHPLLDDAIVYGGLNQSLSGIFQAIAVNDVSYYQCKLYGANKVLKDNLLYLDDAILLRQSESQRPILAKALKLAQDNLDIEKRLFTSQDSTLKELSAAYELKDRVQTSINNLDEKMSSLKQTPVVDTSLGLKQHAMDARHFQARAAALASTVETLSSWDLVFSGGFRSDLKLGTTNAFGNVSLNYSFGNITSWVRSSNVDRLTRNYVDSQFDSPQNLLRRLRVRNTEFLATESKNKTNIEEHLASIRDLLQRVKGSESILSKRVQRALTIEQLLQEASMAATTTKIQELEKWAAANPED